MSLNEIKVHLAPSGSQIRTEESPFATTASGDPVAVITVVPPERAEHPIAIADLQTWLTRQGFRFVRSNPPYEHFEWADIALMAATEAGCVTKIGMNFLLDLNARIRVQVWAKLIEDICDEFGLKLINPAGGLVEPDVFNELVSKSFAWKCFLEREKNSGSTS